MRSFLLALLMPFSFALAAPQSLSRVESYEVLPNSQSQKLIDEAIESMFASPMKRTLCEVYNNWLFLSAYAGISPERAAAVMKTCPPTSSKLVTLPKVFQKHYFLVFAENNQSEIQSWTTEDNRTYLWVTPDLTLSELKKLITHELAMSVDAKMNMYLTTYFTFENMHVVQSDSRTVVIMMPAQLSAKEEKLRNAFNNAIHRPVAYALASMRAFEFEKFVESESQNIKDLSHPECVQQFKAIYQFIGAHPEEFVEDSKSFQGQIMQLYQSNMTPEKVSQILKDIEDPQFTMLDGKTTFCQYMSRPLLSSKSVWSFFAQGPRPRIGGGWSSESVTGQEANANNANLATLKKPGSEAVVPFSKPQDKFLMNEMKQDIFNSKLRKIEKPGQ